MLLCASNVTPPWYRSWQHFFEDPKFEATPSPPRSLPIYAETMASVLVAQSSPSYTHSKFKRYDRQVWGFINSEVES
jgi:hypothetical protein